MPGGVCAVLDYDVEMMAEYVAEMAVRVVTPEASVTSSFRKFVSQVLTSTRLPSTTILLGMNYLAKRVNTLMTKRSPGSWSASEGQVWRFLTVALLLGSKFLDDNTFQNKSWSDVSGIDVAELNTLETEWILDLEWRLYVNLDKQEDYRAWLESWRTWSHSRKEHAVQLAQAAQAPRERIPLQRIETEISRLNLTRQSFPAYNLHPVDVMDFHTQAQAQAQAQAYAAKRRSYHDPPAYRAHDSAWHSHWQRTPVTPPDSGYAGYGTPEYHLAATSGPNSYNDWYMPAFQAPGYQQASAAPVYINRQSSSGFQTHYPFGSMVPHHGLGECPCHMCAAVKQPASYFPAAHPYGTAVMG